MGKELENGRLVRLLSKMGFINERPEFDMEPGWAETGDRYLIKLFRDYVFHQVDENGRPVIDMVHVLTCLNKVCHIFDRCTVGYTHTNIFFFFLGTQVGCGRGRKNHADDKRRKVVSDC